ncbi:MAG: hypothetical protein ACRDRO_02700 [Pseudonocardiaceae bacterium]
MSTSRFQPAGQLVALLAPMRTPCGVSRQTTGVAAAAALGRFGPNESVG